MPSIETKIRLAVEARVATLPSGLPGVVWNDGQAVSPPMNGGQPAPYIEARHMPNATARLFIGSDDPHLRPGILQLTVCWPISNIGTGSGKTHPHVIGEIAGKIAAHFATDLPMDQDGVRVRVEKAPDVAQGYNDDAYFRVPVSIRHSAFA